MPNCVCLILVRPVYPPFSRWTCRNNSGLSVKGQVASACPFPVTDFRNRGGFETNLGEALALEHVALHRAPHFGLVLLGKDGQFRRFDAKPDMAGFRIIDDPVCDWSDNFMVVARDRQ